MSSEQRAALVERINRYLSDGEPPCCEKYPWCDCEGIDHGERIAAIVEAAGWGPRVGTPEPDADARDVLARAAFAQSWSDRDYDEETWFLDREWAQQAAEDDLAALRARGFAVVRAADVEAVLGRVLLLGAGGKVVESVERMKEAIR